MQPSVSHDVLCIQVKYAGWQYTALIYSFPDLEPVCCPICPVLTVASWSSYRFLGRQVRWSGIPISWIFYNLLWSTQACCSPWELQIVGRYWTELNTVKGFGVINKEEVDVFLELSWFFYDPTDVGNLISGSFAFSKSSLNIWKFMGHILLKPGLGNFEHYFARMCDECNCAIVWIFFGIAFLKDWNENRPFPVLWPTINVVGICSGWVGVWPTIGHTHNQ